MNNKLKILSLKIVITSALIMSFFEVHSQDSDFNRLFIELCEEQFGVMMKTPDSLFEGHFHFVSGDIETIFGINNGQDVKAMQIVYTSDISLSKKFWVKFPNLEYLFIVGDVIHGNDVRIKSGSKPLKLKYLGVMGCLRKLQVREDSIFSDLSNFSIMVDDKVKIDFTKLLSGNCLTGIEIIGLNENVSFDLAKIECAKNVCSIYLTNVSALNQSRIAAFNSLKMFSCANIEEPTIEYMNTHGIITNYEVKSK